MKQWVVALVAAMAAALAPSSASAAVAHGYLIDNKCLQLCKGNTDPEAECVPDDINVYYKPELHTKWCLQLTVCVNSGYSILAVEPDATGYHAPVMNLVGTVSKASAVAFIASQPSGPFPIVTVTYDESKLATVSGEVQVTDASVGAYSPEEEEVEVEPTTVAQSTTTSAEVEVTTVAQSTTTSGAPVDDDGGGGDTQPTVVHGYYYDAEEPVLDADDDDDDNGGDNNFDGNSAAGAQVAALAVALAAVPMLW